MRLPCLRDRTSSVRHLYRSSAAPRLLVPLKLPPHSQQPYRESFPMDLTGNARTVRSKAKTKTKMRKRDRRSLLASTHRTLGTSFRPHYRAPRLSDPIEEIHQASFLKLRGRSPSRQVLIIVMGMALPRSRPLSLPPFLVLQNSTLSPLLFSLRHRPQVLQLLLRRWPKLEQSPPLGPPPSLLQHFPLAVPHAAHGVPTSPKLRHKGLSTACLLPRPAHSTFPSSRAYLCHGKALRWMPRSGHLLRRSCRTLLDVLFANLQKLQRSGF